MVKAAVQLDGWMGFETMQGVACGNLAMQEARGCRNMVYSPCRRHEAVVIWFILDKQGRQVSLSYPLFAPTSPRSVLTCPPSHLRHRYRRAASYHRLRWKRIERTSTSTQEHVRTRGSEARRCMSGGPSSDISNSNLQPGPRRPVRPLVAPAPVAQAPVVMAYRLPQELMLLVRAQQDIMVGPLEGGRALAPLPPELEEYLKLAIRQPATNAAQIFTLPPSAPGAQPALLLTLERICRHIEAYKMAHLSQEGRTILWVEGQFGEPALTSFQTMHQEARATESVSGIGQNSVLYRLLRGMIIMYDNPQARKEADRLLLTLTWQKSGVAATHALVNKIFKAHQALATSTVGRSVPTRVSALTWDDEFHKIEAILPSWALKVTKEHPDNFASREALFATLYAFAPAEEGVPQPLRPVRPGSDKIFQLTDDQAVCFPCYPADAEEEELEERWQAVLAQMPVEQRGLYALVMAKNGRPLECFRCGKNHYEKSRENVVGSRKMAPILGGVD